MKRFPHIAGRFGLVLALWVLINPAWAVERACWIHFMGASALQAGIGEQIE